MSADTIIKEIRKLPLQERLQVIEKTMSSVRRSNRNKLAKAVRLLYNDYATDKELTAFSKLDFENFYEAR